MKLYRKQIAIVALALVLVAPYLSLPAAVVAQTRTDPQAQRIEDRDRRENGITVTEPHVFDDAQLQQRLEELEARLATLQVIDQKTITDRFGTVAGASLRSSGFALNVQGAPVPGVETNTKLPTEQVKTTGSSVETTTNLATEDVKTTVPQFNPPPATAPAPTVNIPSSFSTSSSDVLDEMMQVQAEINGLRLLLSGDLSSHYIRGGSTIGNKMTKYKTTLGFDISVKPDEVAPKERYRDAVAIVEVEVENVCETVSEEPPAITALLPREKTYNVAEITDKSTSIGGGVATQLLGVSASFLRSRKTYYLVRDQDTVALTFTPERQRGDICPTPEGGTRLKKRVGFMWQFRPVLGRRYVRIADKTNFVQLAFPVPPDAKDGEIGKATVRTYWRGYDRKYGVVKEIIPGSVKEQVINFEIPHYELAVNPDVFNSWDSIEDLGGGQILVKMPGRFLPGTNVRIGPTILAEGDRFKHRYSGIRFVAPLSDLVTKKAFLVAHDGTEVPLTFEQTLCNAAHPLLFLSTPQVTTLDETNSLVTVRVNHADWAKVRPEDWMNPTPPIVVVVGQRVFGFSDAPLQRSGEYISFVAPTALLAGNPLMTVQTLFPTKYCINSTQVDSFQQPSQAERLALLEQGDKTVKFLLYGTRLSGLTILAPPNTADMPVTVTPVGNPSDTDRLLLVELDARYLKTHKNLLVQRPSERPFLIPIPPLEAPKKPDPPKAAERVTVASDEAVIVGDGLKDVAKVFFKKKQFDASDVDPADDGKSLRLSGLSRLGVTSTAATQPIVLEFKSGAKVTVSLEVVNTKVETVTK